MLATLFDFDGVLVDSEPVHLAAFNDVLGALGVHLGEGEYAAHYLGLDDRGVFRAALSGKRGSLPDEREVSLLVAAKTKRFLPRFEGAFRVYPGAVDLVVRRAARAPVAIVSGALRDEIEFALAKMGVRAAVALVVSAEDAPACKPDPTGYRLALARLGVPDAVAIEDSLAGVEAAKRAGVRCVAVSHTYPAAELLGAGADAVFSDLYALGDVEIDGLRG